MALQRARSLTPLTRTLTSSIPRTSLPASFTSLPLSSRSFTSCAPLFAASPSTPSSTTSSSSSHTALHSASTNASHSHDTHHSSGHGAHGHGEHHDGHEDRSGPDYGLHFHEPARWHKLGAQFFGGLLWFWLLYRAKNDWRYLFFWDNPFDSHDAHHGDEHEAEHGKEHH